MVGVNKLGVTYQKRGLGKDKFTETYEAAMQVKDMLGGDCGGSTSGGGKDGVTPHIGDDGNWWIGTTNTGVPATGPKGEDGKTPYVKDGYWWIGDVNLNVTATGPKGDPGTLSLTEAQRAAIDSGITAEDKAVLNGLPQQISNIASQKADIQALTDEVDSRATADETLQTNIDDAKIKDFSLDAATRILTLTFGDGVVKQITLPQANQMTDGFMTAADVATLVQLVSDMASLKEGGVWRANFETYADMTAAYPNLDVSATNWFANDFVYINVDETHNSGETSYIVQVNGDVKTLVFKRVMPNSGTSNPVATNTSLGITKGSTEKGKIYIESDGSQSLNGYDELAEHLDDNDNPHSVNKNQVGLGNVDNTSDANKPVSTATQTALSGKQNKLSAAQLAAVNSGVSAEMVEFDSGYNTVSTIVSIPVTKRSVLANLSAGGTLSLASTLTMGREISIKARNTGATELTITLTNDTAWESKNTKGENIDSVKIPAGGAVEINIWALDKLIVKTDA